MGPISRGDIVTIFYYGDSDPVRRNMKVKYTPGGPGELWIFDDLKTGNIIELNPSSPGFLEMVKENPDPKMIEGVGKELKPTEPQK